MTGARPWLGLVVAAALASACSAANKTAVAYRNKAREQFTAGAFDKSLADYDRALQNDSGSKIDGLKDERERAATELARQTLKEAWAEIGKANIQDAHEELLALQRVNAWGSKTMKPVLVKALGDTSALLWAEAESLRKKRNYLRAVLLGEHALRELPASHSLHIRLRALRNEAQAFHLARMKTLQRYPLAAALHFKLAQRFGAGIDPAGVVAVAVAKRITATPDGDPDDFVDAAEAAASTDANRTEDLLIHARLVGSGWDPKATQFFIDRYGMDDAAFLEDIWTGGTYSPYKLPDAAVLPGPDDVYVAVEPESDDGPRPRTMDLWYGLGVFTLQDGTLAGGLGGALRIPSKSGKLTYELSGSFESTSLGGDTSGYGGDLILLTRIKAPVSAGIGIGYLDDEIPQPLGFTPLRQKSIHVPIVLRAPLFEGYAASLEYRANILQYTVEESPPMDEPEHFSPGTLRLYGPVPLLGSSVKALRNLLIEGQVSYTRDAPEELTYGGRLVFRMVLGGKDGGGGGGGGSGGDVFDKVENSPFGIQTLVGHAFDMWYGLGTSPLAKDAGARELFGFVGRAFNEGSKSVYEAALVIESAAFGGDVGGWSLSYMTMKAVPKLGLFGYGLGYHSDSISDVPEGQVGVSQTAFYTPLVIRFPVAATLIAELEGRLNYLAFGGTGDVGETRHFHALRLRAQLPIPVLSAAGSFFSKFHMEVHGHWTIKAPSSISYGGMLVYRIAGAKP